LKLIVRFCLFTFALLSSGHYRDQSETDRPMNPESKSRVVYENLDTTFVNLWALLRTLSQRGFIGRVRVELKDYTADVFMTGSSTPLVHEIDRAAGTDTLEEAALHRLVLRARESPGSISVFEGADEAVAVKGTESDTSVRGPQPASAARVLGPPVNHAQDARAATGTEAASRSESEKPAFPSIAAGEPPVADDTPMDAIEWGAVVKASGELIGGVERALTSIDADFSSLFRGARIELADDYTFLDPMSDGFTYSNSIVTLTGEPPASSYVAGVSEALRRVVDRVATGDRARRVRERVALELFSVARKRDEILARSGFRAQLDRIAGTKVI
jgi:hypothetical protein